ncbi:Retrovirus-related Pol polyprotein from transposon 17.6,Retrovirus-related Pol polyprotein from transposon 412,Retrovirus-related Pol polyprotein from transposon 297 [Mytilus edulis]|uniref:Retrovirus-related Pol polyprotein from transposon 17.6,Retrovirus-related Pol polyprotein from transposon 412,Retrovirus-related Pol polyprotein from transposon 297 n=1 Tax=Mytilus edulis TaxID=6550 RepID=A0A8S3U8M1_MYTED|nr:Retrovirus-related Pol polyprotein from transposon 17.6,Retrovirus-related Pol polyprotein from transposon 412,Retrovirus-related Pol polyprotein from transposon 297 [Mytilus edulis]
MPFGLCNAPSCFERLMEIVLQGYQWERCLCYLDDVIIFGPTFEKALENVEFVFERFRQANIKLKPKKFSLFQHQVLFLGHLITDEGIACDPSKIEAVRDWPTPKNINEVRSFLGLAGYYRRFIPEFSEIASTLTHLTKKGIRFEWTTQCQESFECLKSKLISAPILNYPSETGQFILDTDASGHAIGAVLSQIQNGEEKVLAYASKMLSDTQRNYCTTYRELLAVLTFVKHFRHYLIGQNFKIRSDHASLRWLKNFKNPEGMVARWISVLESYNFIIEHRKGSQHTNADALSRKPYRLCKRDDCPGCDKDKGCVKVNPLMAENDQDLDNTIPYEDILEQNETIPHTEDSDDINESLDFSNWLRIWSNEEIKSWQENDSDLIKIIQLKTQSDENLVVNKCLVLHMKLGNYGVAGNC